jgi:twitching motility protein PilT
MKITALIQAAVKYKASDLYLIGDSVPYLRVDSVVIPVNCPPLSPDDVQEIVNTIVPQRLMPRLDQRRGVDVACQFPGLIRCRVIVFYERQHLRVAMRLIPLEAPTVESMELPPILKKIAGFQRGLVLVTGPTGAGKTTTLAAMLDYINTTRKFCITTIENPIEFVYTNKKSIVFQREVLDDVENFNIGLIQALRQAPDVILVGEMRDLETIRTAILAAEVGHMVFSTLHTTTAVQTVERIIAVFPEAEHGVVRDQLGTCLRAVVTQNLVRRAGGKGRIAAMEVLISNATIEKLIREYQLRDIFEVIKTGEDGMQTFDQALAQLTRTKSITVEEAEANARDVFAYRRHLLGATSSRDAGGIVGAFE